MDQVWLGMSYLPNSAIDLNQQNIARPDLSILSKPWVIALIAFYSTSAILSLVSHIISVIVLCRRQVVSPHLTKCLINIGVANIATTLLVTPFTYTHFMLGHWVLPLWLCPVTHFIEPASVLVEVYTLVVIGVDHYLNIVFKVKRKVGQKWQKLLILVFIWFVAIDTAVFVAYRTEVVPFKYGGKTYHDCRQVWGEDVAKRYTTFILVIGFVLPVSWLLLLYGHIFWHSVKHKTPDNGIIYLVRWQRQLRLIRMTFLMLVFHALCLLPINIFSAVIWFCDLNLSNETKLNIYVFGYFLCHSIATSHSMVNPLIYYFMNDEFKSGVKRLLATILCKNSETYAVEMNSLVTNETNEQDKFDLNDDL